MTCAWVCHAERIVGLRWQRSGALPASVSRDGVPMLWRPGHDDVPLKGYRLAFLPTVLAWSPDDRLLAIGGNGGQIAVIDSLGSKAR